MALALEGLEEGGVRDETTFEVVQQGALCPMCILLDESGGAQC